MPEHPYTNRLIHEKSPYLLQHAHNPVNWFPWGNEAFEESMRLDKPIFLSIGYATCHWCHTMEKESFENLEVAQEMNETFISVKVDREELPEIDSLYMEFAQSMMAGAAGWPLNVILTPNLQPFFATTYLPPKSSQGMMGLMDLIFRIREVWSGDEREKIEVQSKKIVEVFAESVRTSGEVMPPKEEIDETAELLFQMADPTYGGMKGTPKFPVGYQYNFMLHYASSNNDSRGIFLVERTLDMMQRGGIYDHLGGGFSRYSVDEQWLIPHFEKMLYDNAILAHSYFEAWQITKRDLYQTICQETLDYILRDMTHSDGGFYSAEDADSEGQEGLFYTWTREEVEQALGVKESELFCEFFMITTLGNFEGRNVLHTPLSIDEFINERKLNATEFKKKISEQKQKLWEVREKRIHPFKDDKILSSWNGLVIHAMARAGCGFEESHYLEAATKSARFIRENMWKNGRLLRRWRDGEAQYVAGLDEYAFLIRGLISLFEVGRGSEWLKWALEMTDILEAQFKSIDGAFFQTDGTDPNLILQRCQYSDGAEPSGNSIHCENLLRIFQLTKEPHYLRQAEDVFKAVYNHLDSYSPGYCYHIINLNRYYDKRAPTIVVSLNEKQEHQEELHRLIFKGFIPHKTVIWNNEQDQLQQTLLPHLKHNPPKDNKTTLYICYQGVCEEPITDLKEMEQALAKL